MPSASCMQLRSCFCGVRADRTDRESVVRPAAGRARAIMSDHEEKTGKLARILQTFSSSDDRLDKALSVLDGSADGQDQGSTQRPSKFANAQTGQLA